MFNGDAQPAQRLPDYNSVSFGMAKEAEPDIVRAARAYEDARRELQHLQEQRQKIDEGIKGAMERMNEEAAHMMAIIQAVEKRAY